MAALDEEAALLRRPARAALLSAPEPPSAIALSVLIRTRNEADRLARTLAAAQPLGAEIVVVDAGSTDDTVAIARAHGARVGRKSLAGIRAAAPFRRGAMRA